MFSKSTEYALRATIYIARMSSDKKKVSINDIAYGIGAPRSFTAKILQHLTKDKRLIQSTPGPSGGFYINEEDKQKSIYTVIEIMGESHIIENCVLGFAYCGEQSPCSMHHVYKHIKKDLLDMFKNKSIDDLAKSKEYLLKI